MEFFHEPKIDWMGIKWYLIALSLALASAGIISMVVKKGLAYGIDFRGGTALEVQFAKAPNVDAIRHELDRQGVKGEQITTYGAASDHEVIIGLDLKTTASSQALDEGKRAIIAALSGAVGQGQQGKPDFNNSSPRPSPITSWLQIPWGWLRKVSTPPTSLTGIWPMPSLVSKTPRRGMGLFRTSRN